MHDNISSHPSKEANKKQIKMCFQVSRLIKKRICFPNIKSIEQLSVQNRKVYIVRHFVGKPRSVWEFATKRLQFGLKCGLYLNLQTCVKIIFAFYLNYRLIGPLQIKRFICNALCMSSFDVLFRMFLVTQSATTVVIGTRNVCCYRNNCLLISLIK